MNPTMAPVTPLTSEQIKGRLGTLPGWEEKEKGIEKTYKFKNYYETIAFLNATAQISHVEDHHPDLEVGYNRLKVRYTTHDAGGVTEKDVECAGKVERLPRPR